MKILLLIIALFFLSCSSSDGGATSSAPDDKEENTTVVIEENTTTVTEENTTVVFRVEVPQITPEDEFVCIVFNDGDSPKKMDSDGAYRWKIDLNNSTIVTTQYKYCRNCECGAADEYLGLRGVSWRDNNTPFVDATLYEDRVSRWRWLDENLTSIEINTSTYLSQQPDINKTNYISGVAFNDWWSHEWLDSMEVTLQKASDDLGVKWVQIIPVPQIKNINDPDNLEIDPYGINGMSDADLNATIDYAHSKGLKVFLNPSPWSFEVDNSDANHTQEWWDSYLNAIEPVLLHYARIAQEKGVEMLEVRAWHNIDSLTTQEALKMENNASILLQNIKEVYTGKIAVQSICYDTDRPILDIHRDADYLMINIWQFYPWAFAINDDANVSIMRDKLQGDIDNCQNYYKDNNISVAVVIEQLAIASFNGAINHEDIEGIDSFHEDNESYQLDLQEQSDSYEAIFQVIKDEEWIEGDFVFTYFFWDSIGKDINIRGKKPIEAEIKKWHGWLNKI